MGPAFAAGEAEDRNQGLPSWSAGKAVLLGWKWALVSSQSARLTLQITEQEIRLVQQGGEKELTVYPRLLSYPGASLHHTLLSLKQQGLTVGSSGKQVKRVLEVHLFLWKHSYPSCHVQLLLFHPENLPRSRSSVKFQWRNMGTLIGGEGKNSGVDGPSLSEGQSHKW